QRSARRRCILQSVLLCARLVLNNFCLLQSQLGEKICGFGRNAVPAGDDDQHETATFEHCHYQRNIQRLPREQADCMFPLENDLLLMVSFVYSVMLLAFCNNDDNDDDYDYGT